MSDVFAKAKRSQIMSRFHGRGNKDTEPALMRVFRAQCGVENQPTTTSLFAINCPPFFQELTCAFTSTEGPGMVPPYPGRVISSRISPSTLRWNSRCRCWSEDGSSRLINPFMAPAMPCGPPGANGV